MGNAWSLYQIAVMFLRLVLSMFFAPCQFRDVVLLTYSKSDDLSDNNMEGYITFKDTKKGVFRTVEVLDRKYFVVQGSNMYYYSKKQVVLLLLGMLTLHLFSVSIATTGLP